MSDLSATNDPGFRAKLGLYVVIGSSVGVIALAIVTMWAASNANTLKDTSQLVFTSVLPLLGTWVGTVLAFYFTKDSLEAASRTTLDVVRSVGQKLASIAVTQAMLKADSIKKADAAAGKVGDLPLKTIESLFAQVLPNGQPISRLPLVNDKGACIGIIHRSNWNEMLLAGGKLNPPVDVPTDKLEKLLPLNSSAGKKFGDIIEGTVAFVASDKTLADAKRAMELVPLCQDVFVTQSGNSAEKMLGWISNVDIARLSQA